MANIKSNSGPSDWDQANSRVYWFAQLELAVAAGNFKLADRAALELRRLGIEVRYRSAPGEETRA